jgi:hypothetical protein
MKYIKYFESLDYYKVISHDEYVRLMGSNGARIGLNKEKLTIQERKILEYLLSTSNPKYVSYRFDKPIRLSSHLSHGTRCLEIENRIGRDLVGYKSFDYGIEKVQDEWFVVYKHEIKKISSINYKCDQLSGLIEFLKDEGIINTNILSESIDYSNNYYKNETWVSKIKWLHDNYYDKVNQVYSAIPNLLESLEGTFENPKYNQGKNTFFLQLGIVTDTSYECFSFNESKLIIDPIDNEDQTKYIISGHSGHYRFDEKLRDIRRDTSRKTVYYPYYKLEGTLSIEGLDILKDVDNRTTRYERFITSLLSDYFKGWKIHTQIRVQIRDDHFWIHLVDKTKI